MRTTTGGRLCRSVRTFTENTAIGLGSLLTFHRPGKLIDELVQFRASGIRIQHTFETAGRGRPGLTQGLERVGTDGQFWNQPTTSGRKTYAATITKTIALRDVNAGAIPGQIAAIGVFRTDTIITVWDVAATSTVNQTTITTLGWTNTLRIANSPREIPASFRPFFGTTRWRQVAYALFANIILATGAPISDTTSAALLLTGAHPITFHESQPLAFH